MAGGRAGARTSLLDRARELHRRGVDASRAGQPAVAERLLLRALDQLPAGDDSREAITLRMQILITLAKAESELRGIDVGLARLEDTRPLLELEPQPVVLTALHNQEGALLARAGRYEEAAGCFDAAAQHFAVAEPRDRAAVLLNRSTIRMLMGDLRGAAGDLERCVSTASQNDLESMSEMALHNLGYLRFVMGDLPTALATMAEANQRENTGVPLLDRARVLLEAGLVREADNTLARAAEIVRRDRLAQDLGEIELERARCALIEGDISGARRLAASARLRFRRRGSDGWRRSAELVLLQGDLAAGRPGTRLFEPAMRLRAEFASVDLRLGARTAALLAAEAALTSGQVETAADLVDGIGPADKRDPITARLHTRYVRAALRQAQRRPGLASREARYGLAELVAYQSSFGSIDLQTAAAVHGRRLVDLDISIALDSRRPGAVIQAAELGRAASNRLPVVRPPADPETATLLAELRQLSESMHATQDRDALLDLQRKRRELEGRIAARGWTLSGAGESRSAAGLDDIERAVVASGSTLVTYVESGGCLHAVVLGVELALLSLGDAQPVVERVRRARADLDVLAQPHLPSAMRAAVRASFDRSMRTLDDALIAPLGVEGRRLTVVSTGALGQLPWAALPSLRGVPIVVAPSATAWVGATRARRSRRRGIVAIAGPGVACGEREAKSVGAAWPDATVHSGGEATRRAVTTALDRGAVVHVAAHGVHNTENALFSSLRMSDGLLFAHELDRTHRTAEHVVLSSCELGLATVRPGDEALGLTSVLLRLGTRSVVAGVARVNDEVTADVMTAYHRRLADGSDSAQALAEAIAAIDEVAPFVCFGSAWRA